MTFYVVGEPEYELSKWYMDIVSGIKHEQRQKRLNCEFLNNIKELGLADIGKDDVILVIGADSEWIDKITMICEALFDNRVIVLGNHERRLKGRKYSIVTTDISRNIKLLYDYLNRNGKKKIALYAINPQSASDLYKKESFMVYNASENDLFYNTVSLDECYKDFSRRIAEYDAVICVNDYAAISLINHLGDNRKIFITSCTGSKLTKVYSPSITHTRTKEEGYAKAGIALSKMLTRNVEINSVDMYLASDFIVGETTDFIPFNNTENGGLGDVLKGDDVFYSDIEINQMIKIEKLLSVCKDEDFLILKMLLKNYSYNQIADELCFSLNGIKYRLKNMFEICGVRTKENLVNLLNQYNIKL